MENYGVFLQQPLHFATEADFLDSHEMRMSLDEISKLYSDITQDIHCELYNEYYAHLINCAFDVSPIPLAGVEDILMCRCCKIDLDDSYFMPVTHPIVRLLYNEEDYLNQYAELQGQGTGIEWHMRNALMSQYRQQRKELYVYGTGQVYFITGNERDQHAPAWQSGYRKAAAWNKVGTLTSLDALRLIQKVKNRYERRESTRLIGKESEVHIAYIGDMTNQGFLKQYFKEAFQLENVSVPLEIYFTRLERRLEYGEYIFERKDIDWMPGADVKRIYNLSAMADMQELFRSFDLVLFLDESYFYKQGQNVKNLSEREVKSHIQWCWQELNRERQAADDNGHTDDSAFKNRERYYYKEIYNKIGLWMNGYGKDRTSKLGFDKELFHIMQQSVNEQSDVYIYISRGETVGDIDLTKQSVCNDERYAGKRLFVYKLNEIAGEENNDASVEVRKLLKGDEENKNGKIRLASIDLWKLLKSIGEAFYAYELDGFNNFSYRSVEIWEKTFLDIYAEGIKAEQKLCYQIRYTLDDMEKDEKQKIEDFVKTYFDICKRTKSDECKGNHSPYSKSYLCDLLTRAMIAKATSALGVFYAYLLRKDAVESIAIEKIENRSSSVDGNMAPTKDNTSLFRGRRLIYSAINGLDQVMVRDMEKRLNILKYDFRLEYCPEMEADVFLELLESIKAYCERTTYEDSRLYLLTK